MLPSPPSKLLEIIRYSWSRDCSVQELARRVQESDELSRTLLQVVSSKHSGAGQEIKTASRATLLLGSKAVGSLTAWMVAARAIRSAEIDPMAIAALYEDALRRSAAMEVLARNTQGITEEHAAAIGMCLELGRADLICQDSTRVIWLDGLRGAVGDSRMYKEKEYLGATHVDAFKKLARRWSLPDEIVHPVLEHHDTSGSVAGNMGHCADLMAEVYTSSEPAQALAAAKVVLKERLDIDPDKVYGMVAALSGRVEQAAHLLGFATAEQPELQTILSQHDDNFEELSREQLMKLIENNRREAKASKEQIEELKGRLMALRAQDALTGLFNRQHYLKKLQREIEQAAGRPGALSLLLLDVDMLDEHNNCHGMATGDAILKKVGALIDKVCAERDFGARVGGDEFALVLLNRKAPNARLAAERLRAAVELAKVDHEGRRARLSATVVGICVDDMDNPSAEALHARAQKELERIKGSNRTGWAA